MATSCILDSMSDIGDIRYELVKRRYGYHYDAPDLKMVLDQDERTLYVKANDVSAFSDVDLDPTSFECINLYDEKVKDYLKDRYSLKEDVPFWVYAYLKSEKIDVDDEGFRKLDLDHLDIINDHYEYASRDELMTIIQKGDMFGLFRDDDLVGFIGTHLDKTMGLLHVFDKYRGHNYGYVLEASLINELIDRKDLIYCNVVEDNIYSHNIQKRLGMTKSEKIQYWLFK